LTALKDKLFALEKDHVQGKISESEYGELKSALELDMRRALSRQFVTLRYKSNRG